MKESQGFSVMQDNDEYGLILRRLKRRGMNNKRAEMIADIEYADLQASKKKTKKKKVVEDAKDGF